MQFNLITGERRVYNGFDIVNVLEHNVQKVGGFLNGIIRSQSLTLSSE